MDRALVARRVRIIIARELAVPFPKVREDSEFRANLGADSLDMVHLPALIEDEFGVRFSDADVEFCRTVGTAIDLVETKLENRGVL